MSLNYVILGCIFSLLGTLMSQKFLTVCKANEVIEAGYRLSLNEQRVILAPD